MPSAHPLHQKPNKSSGVTTKPEDSKRGVTLERIPCSGLRPPRYPTRPSKAKPNQHSSSQRSAARRPREVGKAGSVAQSGTRNARVPRQARVQRDCRGGSAKGPSEPLQPAHSRPTCHSGSPAACVKAESAEDTLERAREHARVKAQKESAMRVARERERRRQVEEEFSLRLSRWKAEADRRNRREEGADHCEEHGPEAEQCAQERGWSGVYRREQHQRPRCWAAARVWKTVRGFADITVVEEPPLGVWERISLRS